MEDLAPLADIYQPSLYMIYGIYGASHGGYSSNN